MYLHARMTFLNWRLEMVSWSHEPEEDAEGVDVDARLVRAGEHLGRHVDGRADDAAGHHRLRLAEAQVGQLAAVALVQLQVFVDANSLNRRAPEPARSSA